MFAIGIGCIFILVIALVMNAGDMDDHPSDRTWR